MSVKEYAYSTEALENEEKTIAYTYGSDSKNGWNNLLVGNAHGATLHKFATNMEAGKMAASGRYSQIGLNKALKTMGLNGTKRPDVIGIAPKGFNKLVEVISPRQSISYIANKMTNMLSDNPGFVEKIVTWVRRLFK